MNKRGFTLIELLVVIAIIGMLSSVVLASLNTARASSRDSRRIQDIQQVRTALELYYQENGRYPIQASWTGTSEGCYSGTSDPDASIPGLAPDFIGQVPEDPKPVGGSCYLYRSDSGGANYKFLVHGSVESGVAASGEIYARCPTSCSVSYCSQRTYAIYTDGAVCW